MLSVFDSGLAGLRAADLRASVRAQNIVNWQSQDYRPLEPQQTTNASGAPVLRISRTALTVDVGGVDLAAELVDLGLAKNAYRAAAAVIRTADDMSKTLLDTFA